MHLLYLVLLGYIIRICFFATPLSLVYNVATILDTIFLVSLIRNCLQHLDIPNHIAQLLQAS